MYLFIKILIGFIFYFVIQAEFVINKVEMRPPKDRDIGLMFDIDIVNSASKEKTALGLHIRCDLCCIEIIDELACDKIPKMYGGSFGTVTSGSVAKVSLLWPATILYNRKGYCNMSLLAPPNPSNKSCTDISFTIQFDTNIYQISDQPNVMTAFIKGKNISECNSTDLNPFTNCEPVDCDEKYFGARNYFNRDCNLCQVVPNCSGENIIYNILSNRCEDITKLVSDEDIQEIKSGKFQNQTWNLKREIVSYPSLDDINEVNLANENVHWRDFFSGLAIATAVIGIYFLLCFGIFMCVNLCSKRVTKNGKT